MRGNSIILGMILGAASMIFAAPVYAHMVVKNSFVFSGILNAWAHPIILLLLLAYSCGISQNLIDREHLVKVVLIILVFSILTGVWVKHINKMNEPLSLTTLMLIFFMGVIGALKLRIHESLIFLISFIHGICFGTANFFEMDLPVRRLMFFSIGVILAAVASFMLFVFLLKSIKNRSFEIGIRILCSWCVAISAMMLAFCLKKGTFTLF